MKTYTMFIDRALSENEALDTFKEVAKREDITGLSEYWIKKRLPINAVYGSTDMVIIGYEDSSNRF